eukprot:7497080-Prorocentrum_lima.AAC.1
MCIRDSWKTFQALLHGSIAEQIWSGLGYTTCSKANPPADLPAAAVTPVGEMAAAATPPLGPAAATPIAAAVYPVVLPVDH